MAKLLESLYCGMWCLSQFLQKTKICAKHLKIYFVSDSTKVEHIWCAFGLEKIGRTGKIGIIGETETFVYLAHSS